METLGQGIDSHHAVLAEMPRGATLILVIVIHSGPQSFIFQCLVYAPISCSIIFFFNS